MLNVNCSQAHFKINESRYIALFYILTLHFAFVAVFGVFCLSYFFPNFSKNISILRGPVKENTVLSSQQKLWENWKFIRVRGPDPQIMSRPNVKTCIWPETFKVIVHCSNNSKIENYIYQRKSPCQLILTLSMIFPTNLQGGYASQFNAGFNPGALILDPNPSLKLF